MENRGKQHILLAVTGLSPQVITETLYALHKQQAPMPKRIVVITTKLGARELQAQLLDGGKLRQFYQDYGLDPVSLTTKDILVVPDAKGQPMEDTLDESDHIALSDCVCNTVREITNAPNTVIHASIAGGRKTMTFLLGYAMSLFARKGDVLSHTLVTKGYESSAFFYPTPRPRKIRVDGKSLNAQDAEVMLVQIPFVRLRDGFPARLLNGTASYSETVEFRNIDQTGQALTLNIEDRSVNYCGHTAKMQPLQFAFYLWFCHRAIDNLPGLPIPFEDAPETGYPDDFLHHYRWFKDSWQLEKVRKESFEDGMDEDYFQQRKSRVNTVLKKTFGNYLGGSIMIEKIDKSAGRNRYGLKIAGEQIFIEGGSE